MSDIRSDKDKVFLLLDVIGNLIDDGVDDQDALDSIPTTLLEEFKQKLIDSGNQKGADLISKELSYRNNRV